MHVVDVPVEDDAALAGRHARRAVPAIDQAELVQIVAEPPFGVAVAEKVRLEAEFLKGSSWAANAVSANCATGSMAAQSLRDHE
ncbi:hypothetical protein GCM10010399_88130 [Dactylosporangium fulvum]